MSKNIIFETRYRGYELNKTKKNAEGFFRAPLERLIDLAEAAHLTQVLSKPRAYHYVLDSPDMGKMKRLSNFLDRHSAKVAKSKGEPIKPVFYIVAYEKRQRKGGEHAHLYVIVDGWGWFESETLRHSLRASGFSEKVSVQKRQIQSRMVRQLVDTETGEVLSEGPVAHSSRFHDLRTELRDFVERASYIAKVLTKKEQGRRYSASRLPAHDASKLMAKVLYLRGQSSRAEQRLLPPSGMEESEAKAVEGPCYNGLSNSDAAVNRPICCEETGK